MNVDSVVSTLDNMNIDCVNTNTDNMNIDGGKTETESMSPSTLEKSEPYDIFKQLPLEIINKIVLQLDFNDILNLKLINKMWRCVYVNQDEIWAKICDDLNIRAIDYNRCLNDRSRHDSECLGYAEVASEKLFGPLCDYWLTFNHYIMILKNIKTNDFPTIYIPRQRVEQSYCTDDYIVNINYHNRKPIEVIVLNGANKPISKRILPIFNTLRNMMKLKKYPLKVIGNKRFLVIEVCSVIFVYSIKNTEFNKKFYRVVQSYKDDIDKDFLNNHLDTKIDLCDHILALVHPAISTLFLINLSTEKVYKEFCFSSRGCIVDNMKYSNHRIMIGITKTNKENLKTEHFAYVYHIKGWLISNRVKLPLLKPATQFKETKDCVGVENAGYSTPFILKQSDFTLTTFWIECDTFSFDYTRNYIYYNVGQRIFQYDLTTFLLFRYEVVEKINTEAISKLLPPINDRYMLVRMAHPNSYEIFDVKEQVSVRCIQLTPGYSLVHVGKLSIIFSNSITYMVVAFN